MSTEKKQSSSFLKGATILSLTGIASRLLGLFYKVPLYHLVGSYGNGIYGNVTSIYNTLLMVSTVGLPTAISKMVSEEAALDDYRGVRDVLHVSLVTLCVIGGLSTLFLFFGADWLIEVSGWSADSYASIMAIAMAPFIISVCSAFRGFFQGFQIMTPTAISQILEQIVRVGLGIFLAWFATRKAYGIGFAVGGAVLGATIGGIVAVLVMIATFLLFRSGSRAYRRGVTQKPRKSKKQLFKRLLQIAIPITLTSCIVSIFASADSMMYISRLEIAGIDAITATEMFGDYTNVDTLINIPLVISGNLAVAMIPAIAESFALKDRENMRMKIDTAIRLVMIVAMPCCIGLSVLSDGIFDLLFSGSVYGGSMMRVFAFATIFMMLSNTFQSILQSVDKMRVPLLTLLIGAVIRLVSVWILMAIPGINIYGIGISSLLTFAFLTVVNFYFVKRYTKVKMRWGKTVIVPVAASVLMGGVCMVVYKLVSGWFGNAPGLILAIGVSVLIYIPLIFIFQVIREDELCAIPGGTKLVPIYRKLAKVL